MRRYKIIVECTQVEEVGAGLDCSGGSIRPMTKNREVTRTVYEQTREGDFDIMDVIKAFNGVAP